MISNVVNNYNFSSIPTFAGEKDILIINDETGTYSFYLVNGKLVVDNHGSINNLVSSQFWVNNYTVSPIYDHLDVISGVEVNLTYYSTRDSNKTITLQRTFTYK